MLKLKRVEIQGFKSFVERTELRFAGEGIAAIVGPNGCGKSNLSDAISWVLGEQSAKTLRGARMEDVIFAGTRERKPLGMAQVTMTLVDPNFHKPVASVEAPAEVDGEAHYTGHHVAAMAVAPGTAPHSGEVTITRRLYRSGESEYLIDGRTARLRDIQDLFMGTGLGPESYAIIEQGRIGQLLSSKPADRRAVIEEAAGITKYKTRRRLAEAKLEGAKQNLARVFDILEEVTRQVNSLKRQAAKAKRYGELKLEMDGRLRVLLAAKFLQLNADATKAQTGLDAAGAELRELTVEVSAKEHEHGTLQQTCYDTEARLTDARKQLAELNVDVERTRGRLESQARQIGAIEHRITQGEAESQEIDARLAELEREAALHAEAVAELERRTQDSRDQVMSASEQRDVLHSQLRERERGLEAGRIAVLKLLGEASTLKNQLAQVDEYLAGVDREMSRARREEQIAGEDLERLTRDKEAVASNFQKQQLEVESIQEQRQRAEEELSVRKLRAAESRRSIDELRDETSRLKARRDSLDEILSHRAYTTESVKRLFGAVDAGQAADFKPLGVLADFVEVDPAYEKAAEEFLHEELEYVVVKDWASAERGLDLLRTDLEGRATFLVHPEAGEPGSVRAAVAEPVIGPETGIVARLSDCLKLVNGLKDRAQDLLPRLATCFVAEDRAAAQRLSAQYSHLYFLLADGVVYHGHALSGGRKRGSGPLALKRELRELQSQFADRDRALAVEVERLSTLDHEIALISDELERLRTAQQATEKSALALDHEIRKLSEELARTNSRLSVSRLDLERLRQEQERSIDQREKSRLIVEEKEQARFAQEAALESARNAVEDLAAEVQRAQEEHSVVRVRLAELEERMRAEKSAGGKIETQVRERTQRKQILAIEIERIGAERARLLADNIDLEQKSSLLAEQVLETEQRVNRLATEEVDARQRLAAAEESIKAGRLRLDDARDRRSQIEVALVRLQAELKYLDETSRKELNQPLDELSAGASPLDEAALTEAEAAYQELRTRIEAMGPVNPTALEEFEEAQQRYDFLSTQRQDLLDSIRDTEKAIQEIDVVSRQRFAEAFEAINANFRVTFTTLFGGGVGEMRLTDESNVSESGIDLIASPPGKKLQNVLLLSGGEKALTAMALLMAIFRYQPSPFCVLDEVDAPLDEANIGRFTRLLKEMSLETQFVLITHSKKTMESAQNLYGVTMQEPGVSKLVSVNFARNIPPPINGRTQVESRAS